MGQRQATDESKIIEQKYWNWQYPSQGNPLCRIMRPGIAVASGGTAITVTV
jgi:hypothetical protein